MKQILGRKYDPAGEYIRQWLPELARMPAEWIHHPWDAPLTLLTASGVELGQNYPKPIIDIDLAREQLTQAIFKMWETEAATKASSSQDRQVVDENEKLLIPKVFLKDKVPHGATSANDQTVPILQNLKSDDPPNKRQKCTAEEDRKPDKSRNRSDHTEVSCIDQEDCSTAESSSKRQCSSTSSFSVP